LNLSFTGYSIRVFEPGGTIAFSKKTLGITEVSPFKTCPSLPKKDVTKLGQFTVSKGASIIIYRYAREVHSEVVEAPQI
jgi:hypothetical protein